MGLHSASRALSLEQAHALRACLLEAWTDGALAEQSWHRLVVDALSGLKDVQMGGSVRIAELQLTINGNGNAWGRAGDGLAMLRAAVLHAESVIEPWETRIRLGIDAEDLAELRARLFVEPSASDLA